MARMVVQALMDIDVRAILGSVRTPTLVLARRGDRVAPFEGSAAMAAAIPGAEFRELPPGTTLASTSSTSFRRPSCSSSAA
jgi:pimeloyl-ACP methyl ester carboxylesterase